MNETFKMLIGFIIGTVVGTVLTLFIRWLTSRAYENRMGTDTNVIKKVNTGLSDVADTIEHAASRLDRSQETVNGSQETASRLADTLRDVDNFIRTIEARQ